MKGHGVSLSLSLWTCLTLGLPLAKPISGTPGSDR